MLQGSRLRSLRLKKNFTQQYLAEVLDLNIRQITRYENGEADPSGEVITRMADAFNVSADYLLGRTDDPTPCFQLADLTLKERAVLSAIRRGEALEAIKAILTEV